MTDPAPSPSSDQTCRVAHYITAPPNANSHNRSDQLSIRWLPGSPITGVLAVRTRYNVKFERADGQLLFTITKRDSASLNKGAIFRMDGTAPVISFGTAKLDTGLPPFSAAQGRWQYHDHDHAVTVSLLERSIRMPRLTREPRRPHLPPQITQNFKLIEPLAPARSRAGTIEPDFLRHILEQIRFIEANSSFQLDYSTELDKWVFTSTIE